MSETPPHKKTAEPLFFRLFDLFFDGVAAAVLFAVMLITGIDVIGRYFFSAPLPGATELTEWGVAIIVFAALPQITRRRQHVEVDLFDRFLPLRFRHWRDVIAMLLMAVCLAALAGKLVALGRRAADRGVVSEYLQLPQHWLIGFIALMCALSAAAAVLAVFRRRPS